MITEQDLRAGLEQSLESMASYVLALADLKQQQIQLQQRIDEEKRRLLDDITIMRKDVKQQEVRLTEQLLERSESITRTALLSSTDHGQSQVL